MSEEKIELITRKQYMSHDPENEKYTHQVYYGQFATRGVLNLLSGMVGRILVSKDPHLNDIPIKEWDHMGGCLPNDTLRSLAKANGTGGVSPSDRVCVLKAAARHIQNERLGKPKVNEYEGLPSSTVSYDQKTEIVSVHSFMENRHVLSLRYDDNRSNGHNTFTINLRIEEWDGEEYTESSWGCVREEITEIFPEYAHLLKWHLFSSDGPIHYIDNSMSAASDTDCYGKKLGEVTRYDTLLKFENFPILVNPSNYLLKFLKDKKDPDDFVDVSVVAVPYEYKVRGDDCKFKPHYVFSGMEECWYKHVCSTREEAEQLLEAFENYTYSLIQIPTDWSSGGEPDLDAARIHAKWPEAELEDFTVENLKNRLPAMMHSFKKGMEELGFDY